MFVRLRFESCWRFANFLHHRSDAEKFFARGSSGYISTTSFLALTRIQAVDTLSFLLRRCSSSECSFFSASPNHLLSLPVLKRSFFKSLAAAAISFSASPFHLQMLGWGMPVFLARNCWHDTP
ncbi:unnamed protein product [Ectocarpus sp. CCAP 1310/34]|nr:unnamed protein product [Ectocarpus sp. CCAP 1310/34]